MAVPGAADNRAADNGVYGDCGGLENVEVRWVPNERRRGSWRGVRKAIGDVKKIFTENFSVMNFIKG